MVQDWFIAEEMRLYGYESVHRVSSPGGHEWHDRAGVLLSDVRFLMSSTLLAHPWGTIEVRYVVLASDSTTVTVTMTQHPEFYGSGSGMYLAPWGNGYPDPMTLRDDQGATTKADARPSGVCSEEVWHATFHADRPLAVNTAWVEIDGHRLVLAEPPGGIDVHLEPGPESDPAREHLWRRVAEHFAEPPCYAKTPLEPTIEALVAAGTLTWEDPEVQDALAVVSATASLGGLAPFPTEQVAAQVHELGNRTVPEPWASLLAARARGHGPNGLIVIGATTPTFDGVTIQVVALDSTPESFDLDVRIHDATAGRPGDLHFGQPQVTWWAKDDRGNAYLGHLGTEWPHGHVSGFGFGQVSYRPPLDPTATWLDLMPTTATSRAVVRVPLRWVAPP